MAKSRKLLYWAHHHFHSISIAFFICAYSIGFGLGGSDNNFYLGLILLTFYMVFSLCLSMIKSRSCLTRSISIFTATFWLINLVYIIISSPKIEDAAYHDGTAYLLTHHQHVLEPQLEGFSLTKWQWGTFPQTTGVPGRWGEESILYDDKLKVLEVVRNVYGESTLVYSDDGKHILLYKGGFVYRGNRYYLSDECLKESDNQYYPCASYKYTIFECAMNNTSCVAISQYIGPEWAGFVDFNEIANEIEFIIKRDFGTSKAGYILVYSYGLYPRCYIEGCKILHRP